MTPPPLYRRRLLPRIYWSTWLFSDGQWPDGDGRSLEIHWDKFVISLAFASRRTKTPALEGS
jgi:hypothetical protein